MQKLTPELHPALNDDRLINSLQQQNITTISDFLRTESNKLKQLLNIDLDHLVSIKADFWQLIGISPVDGFEHYRQLERQSKCTPTGIKSLDNLLRGGLIFGHLIDVCGLSASGKTQLHTTIAVNWSINFNYETFVIDTKGDISGERIHSMLANRRQKFTPEQCKQIMRNIRVEKCNNSLMQLIECAEHLLQSMHLHRKFKLLVIDSLPALWFMHHGSKSTYHYRQLATLADLLRKLAVDHGIVVLAVNIQTRLIVSNELFTPSPSSDDVDENEADDIHRMEIDANAANQTLSSPIAKEIHVPTLGKYWKSTCSIRLQLGKSKPTSTAVAQAGASTSVTPVAITKQRNERIIRILKSDQHPVNTSCVVHIKDAGIE